VAKAFLMYPMGSPQNDYVKIIGMLRLQSTGCGRFLN